MKYRWYILTLCVLTNILVFAVQSLCMPVLFNEISLDINLSLVQIGLVWGIVSLPGMVTGLIGGALGDKFGPKRVLIVGCLLTGMAGAARGLSVDFYSLLTAMFVFGMVSTFIPMITLKTVGIWFPSKQLGIASGALSMGMAAGFLIGSLVSATVLSPFLGSWRNVLFLYGSVAMFVALLWIFTRPSPVNAEQLSASSNSIFQNMQRVARFKNVWLFGLALFGVNGCVQGAIGYLPIYLNDLGWQQSAADGANALFYASSMTFTILIAWMSDRLASRPRMALASGALIVIGVGTLFFAQGSWIWASIFIAGLAGDGFMAVILASVMETKGVGSAFAGAALGMVMVFSRFGSLISPILGNSLAIYNPSLPFLFWALFGGLGLSGMLFLEENKKLRKI
jgi:MFS family permease